MQHPYFTEDGFVGWFEEELKQMLERDAQDFKMRQKKFRKGKRSDPDRSSQQQAQGAHHAQQPPAQAPPPLHAGKHAEAHHNQQLPLPKLWHGQCHIP